MVRTTHNTHQILSIFYLETHIQPTHTHCFHPHTKPGKRLSFFWVPLYLHDAWLKHTQVLCHHKQDGDRPAPKNLPHCEKNTTHIVKPWIQSNCEPSQTMNPIKLNIWTQSKHEQADKEDDQNRREKHNNKTVQCCLCNERTLLENGLSSDLVKMCIKRNKRER